MEEFKKRQVPPRLLDLIPNGIDWKMRDDAQGLGGSRSASFGSEHDDKLELKLGLPGLVEQDIRAGPRDDGLQQDSPDLLPGYFPKSSKAATSTTTTGTKRGFLDIVETKTEDRNEQKQQPIGRCQNELALDEKIAAGSEREKGCCPPPPSHAPTAPSVRNSGNKSQAQGRRNSAPVVGWPPIRPCRRNLANSSSSRQPPEPQNVETSTKEKLTCMKKPLIKINMDGIPIGRKIDLAAYDNYESLSAAVKELFRGFLEAQKDTSRAESAQNGAGEKIFSQLLDGSGEYTLVYEDNEGDRMLVGDVPWNVFVATAKRLRVLRSSELSHGLVGLAPRKLMNC